MLSACGHGCLGGNRAGALACDGGNRRTFVQHSRRLQRRNSSRPKAGLTSEPAFKRQRSAGAQHPAPSCAAPVSPAGRQLRRGTACEAACCAENCRNGDHHGWEPGQCHRPRRRPQPQPRQVGDARRRPQYMCDAVPEHRWLGARHWRWRPTRAQPLRGRNGPRWPGCRGRSKAAAAAADARAAPADAWLRSLLRAAVASR